MEVGVCEEEEGDFGAEIGSAEAGFGGGEGGFLEEREVVEFVGEGNWGEMARREDSWGEEEDDGEGNEGGYG